MDIDYSLRASPPTAYRLRLAKVIRKRREQLGMSVADLAPATGLPEAGVHAIERGEVDYSVDVLDLISDALNIPAFELASAADQAGD